jgi:hypothetical protein
MNVGYKILLARISSHPEEFAPPTSVGDMISGKSKWTGFRWAAQLEIAFSDSASGGFISTEQREALNQALMAAQGEAFTKGVLSTLFEDSDDSSGGTLPLFGMNGGQ